MSTTRYTNFMLIEIIMFRREEAATQLLMLEIALLESVQSLLEGEHRL